MTAKLHYVLSIAMLLAVFSMYSQNTSWKKIETTKNFNIISKLNLDKNKTHVFQLDMALLKASLPHALNESAKNKQKTTSISIPGEGGRLETFQIYEKSVFSPELAEKYPTIKSYVGVSTEDSNTQLRMSVSPQGVQTMISYGDNAMVFMQPVQKGSNAYVLYNRSTKVASKDRFECKTFDDASKNLSKTPSALKTTFKEGGANNQILQKFRIAISTTAEYTAYHNDGNNANGDAIADALAAINASLTRVNAVFETDMAITFELVDATQLIYTNTATDPYSRSSVGVDGVWSSELQNTLTASIGENAYDIGHLFGATGGGGNAGCIGCVCIDGSKGSGYTSPSNGVPEGDTFDIDFVAHEIGHQMGANHTWAFDTEDTGVNSEPGSGSTIMAYAGIEGSNNVALNSDPYFHYQSLKQILDNLTTKSCQTTEVISNRSPLANAGADYTIPKGTAYVLKATASDGDAGDNLTYCWEQIDSGLVNYLNFGPDLISGSTNRSLPPSVSSNRYIPKLNSVLAGNTTQTHPILGSDWETVSTVARDLNWALTVRDRNPVNAMGAQSSFDTMKITVENVAPFTVTNPVSWAQGSDVIINWEVGQTTNATINCQLVTIKLSTDGGLTFPITIASKVPNNGVFNYNVPSIPNTSSARLLIEAADNIFYDISDFYFSISPEPDFFIVEDTLVPIICDDTSTTFNFNYVTANGFSESTVFSATNLPSGASAIFSPTQLATSGAVTLTINNLSVHGDYEPTIVGTSPSITKFKNVSLSFYNGLCSSIANTEYQTSTTLVQFNTINNASGKPSGYNDYTSISTQLTRKSSYGVTVKVNTDGDFTTSTYLWIDWNQNCSFNDVGERYNLGDAKNVTNGQTSNVPLFIAVPETALLGNTTMRITTKFKSDGQPSACENGFDGEVEDYTLQIIESKVSISKVVFNTIENLSSASAGYTDFTSISTEINRVGSYALSVYNTKNGDFETSTQAWVDWNQNSNIEEDEEVYNLGNSNSFDGLTANAPLNIRVPVNALLGNTIMRISTVLGKNGLHRFEMGNNDGEVEDYTLNIMPTEAIETFGFENLKVFPNPSDGIFNIQLNGSLYRNIHVSVFDVSGKHIFENEFPNTGDFLQELQMNRLQSGIYLLVVTDGVKKASKKIIIR